VQLPLCFDRESSCSWKTCKSGGERGDGGKIEQVVTFEDVWVE